MQNHTDTWIPRGETFYESLLQDLPALICRWQPDGTITFVNDNYATYFGTKPAALLGNSFLPLIPEADREIVQGLFSSLRIDAPTHSHEHRVILPEGEVRWQEWTNRGLFDAAGRLCEIQSTGRDITAHKQAAAHAHAEVARQARQHVVLNAVTAAEALIRGELETFSRQLTELAATCLGTERANVWLFNADESELHCIDLYEASSGKHSSGMVLKESEFENEFHALKQARYVDADNPLTDSRTAGYVESYLKPLRISSMLDAVIQISGKHIGLLCLEHVEQAHHWEADEIAFACQLADKLGLCHSFRQQQRERELSEQALRLQAAALEAAANGIVITDADGLIEWANPAFLAPTGYSLELARGRRPADLVGSGQQDKAFYEELWATILGDRIWRGSVVNRRHDGELRTEEMTITPVKDTEGRISHFIAVKQDITDRLALEQQLHRAQRLESVGQLTGGIAHDFNNILTVVLGNAEVLGDALSDDDRLAPLADMIVRGAQRGAKLTHRLLAFARQQPLDPKLTDPKALVEGMLGLLHRALGEHIEIELKCGRGLWPVMIDAAQLESALLNLAINARDAMPEGGKLIISTTNFELDEAYAARNIEVQPGAYVRIAVSDSGCGIPSADLERVLEPFYTTKGSTNGSGLGLSMVYGFAKQSGGHLKLYSEVGMGTTVNLYLPRAGVHARLGAVSREPAISTAKGGAETILLVEDDELVRHYAESQLAALGYRVLSAVNGPEALETLRRHEGIDLLFTDIVMPGGMNGRELAHAACKLHPTLRVLFTSGYSEDAVVQHGRLEAGMRLLSKPYRRTELAAKVREALCEAPRTQELAASARSQ